MVSIDWQNLTALGVLAVVLGFIVIKMLPDLHAKFIEQANVFSLSVESIQRAFTDTLDKMHGRMDEREKMRHADQQALSQAITELTAQCARRQAEVKGNC